MPSTRMHRCFSTSTALFACDCVVAGGPWERSIANPVPETLTLRRACPAAPQAATTQDRTTTAAARTQPGEDTVFTRLPTSRPATPGLQCVDHLIIASRT